MNLTEKLNLLPENVRELLKSNDVRLMLERACFLYDINEDDIEKLSLTIADIFFKEVPIGQLPIFVQRNLNIPTDVSYGIAYELNSKMFNPFPEYFIDAPGLLTQWGSLKAQPLISEEKAWKRVLEIEPWILEEEKEKEKERKDVENKVALKTESLSLAKALEKYPKISEQILTSTELKSRIFPTLVRSSVKNWIMEYHDVLGGGKHSPIERGNYLFHGENGKVLNPAERQKVGLVLKSLDDESPLMIDIESEKIAFEIPANPSSNSTSYTSNAFNTNVNRQTTSDLSQAEDIFDKFKTKAAWPTQTHFQKPENKRATGLSNAQFIGTSQQAPDQSQANVNQQRQFTNQMPGKIEQQPTSVNDQRIAQFSPQQVAMPQRSVAASNSRTTSPNFASAKPTGANNKEVVAGGVVTYSSAQKFASEQNTNPTYNQPVINTMQRPPQAGTQSRGITAPNSFHIAPRSSGEVESEFSSSKNQLPNDFKTQNLDKTSYQSQTAPTPSPAQIVKAIAPQANQISLGQLKSQHSLPTRNPYHIAPRSSSEDLVDEVREQINSNPKNVVNLKENQ